VEDHVAAPFAADYLLRVKGDSMINAGILDGDLVAVKQQSDARDGQIVVALLEDEATVKRVFREPGGVRLEAENEAYEPIRSPDITVIGRVVGVMRDL
jgi:repressor LexA